MTTDNARDYLDAGASHVIVTSLVFRDGRLEEGRLRDLVGGAPAGQAGAGADAASAPLPPCVTCVWPVPACFCNRLLWVGGAPGADGSCYVLRRGVV